MYGDDHGVPHIHVKHGAIWVKVAINDGSIMAGGLHGRQRRLVESWVKRRRKDLLDAWERAQLKQPPGEIAE